MISVGNSTMTITTLILLLATGILAVTAMINCPNKNATITSCCDLNPKLITFAKIRTKQSSGIYLVNIPCGDESIIADGYCDSCNGGGWIVVQRRQDGSVNFNKTWMEYEAGFGKLTGEFWYGLRALHCLTGQGGWEMRMDIKLIDGINIILQYEQFKVASARDNYKLTVGGFQGTTTDPMATHNGMSFSTKDRDNDQWEKNCALANGPTSPQGGWWYKECWHVNPNNSYKRLDGIYLSNKWHAIAFIEMKIRHHNCNM